MKKLDSVSGGTSGADTFLAQVATLRKAVGQECPNHAKHRQETFELSRAAEAGQTSTLGLETTGNPSLATKVTV